MFDRIKFKLDCSAKIRFNKEDLFHKSIGRNTYRIYNKFNNEGEPCKISHIKNDGGYKFDVNLRKFHFGEFSINDLTIISFEKALHELSESIGISVDTLIYGELISCEIGLNIKTRVTCDKIINRIRRFGEYKPSTYFDESFTFHSDTKNIKIYDKILDIRKKMRSRKVSKSKQLEILEKFGDLNFLRIELAIKNKKGFNIGVLKKVNTIADLYEYYYVIYEVLCMQIAKIKFKYSVKTFDNGEFEMLEFFIFNYDDYDVIMNEWIKYATRNLTGGKKADKKSKLKKKFDEIIEKGKYYTKYRKENLLVDVFMTLKNRKNEDENMKLKKLMLILWSSKLVTNNI